MIVAAILLLELLIAATVAIRRMRNRWRGPSASIAAFDATMAALDSVAGDRDGTRAATFRRASQMGPASSHANVFALDDYRVRRSTGSLRASVGRRGVTQKTRHTRGG
jgi:hypothetical protein